MKLQLPNAVVREDFDGYGQETAWEHRDDAHSTGGAKDGDVGDLFVRGRPWYLPFRLPGGHQFQFLTSAQPTFGSVICPSSFHLPFDYLFTFLLLIRAWILLSSFICYYYSTCWVDDITRTEHLVPNRPTTPGNQKSTPNRTKKSSKTKISRFGLI